MDDLFMKQELLFKMHCILITCFSFKDSGSDKFRVYFKDLSSGYLHNPLVESETGKRAYIAHDSYEGALEWAVNEAETYLNNKK